MKVYILPSEQEKFAHKISLMSKHLPKMPKVEFSEPQWRTRETHFVYDKGWSGYSKTKETIQVVEVTIEDIKEGDWVLVADVLYKEGIKTMVSHKYYKDIPEKYGLGYEVCDYCGHHHSNRTKAHIVYNPKTGEWKQIGSTCVTKMFGSEYLNQFTVKLFKLVEECTGCCDPEMLGMWFASIPDHHYKIAHLIDSLLPVVKGYWKEKSNQWERSYWESGRKVPGTTKFFEEYWAGNADRFSLDKELSENVRKFVEGLDGSNDFNREIKEAWEAQYIQLWEIHKVWFALKMYEDSLTIGDWENKTAGFVEGESVELRNVKMVSKEEGEDEWGMYWWVIFENNEGIKFGKSFTSMLSLETSYQNPDGTYSFKTNCHKIDNKKRIIVLKGRCSRLK